MTDKPRTGTDILESIEKLLAHATTVYPTPIVDTRKRESDNTVDLYKALSIAQKEFLNLNKSGLIAGRNTQYAKLSDLFDATSAALLKNDLVCHTRILPILTGSALVTRLVHFTTGQFIESELPLLNNTDEQKRGSSITYAWRYTYAPLLGLVDSSYDDDGEATKKK